MLADDDLANDRAVFVGGGAGGAGGTGVAAWKAASISVRS
jgi:hypothetical protein